MLRHARSFAILGQDSTPPAETPNSLSAANTTKSHSSSGASLSISPFSSKAKIDLSSIHVPKRNGATVKPHRFIHAADLARDGAPAPSDCPDIIRFQYPASRIRERYELVVSKDKIDPTTDILSAARSIAEFYLTESEAEPFTDPETGFIRRFEKAINRSSNEEFRSTLADYNAAMRDLMDRGTISANLSRLHDMPPYLTHFILGQCYDRAVAPEIEKVAKYEAGTDYVYGELKAQFISEILVTRCNMKCDQVFIDLGSGVGNVVLQAALEIGCESWGWEYQEECCNLAEAQLKEFRARCQLWGLSPGRCHLGRGDFCKSSQVIEVLRRADAVLVNNQVFTSPLNDALVRMFLDLKPGCKVVSLKSFVQGGTNVYNVNDVGSTILDVEEFTYPEDWVSWTARGGAYYVSTRK